MLAPKIVGLFLFETVGGMAIEDAVEELVRKRACSGSRLWADRLRPGRKPTPVHFDVEQWLDTVHIGQLDDWDWRFLASILTLWATAGEGA